MTDDQRRALKTLEKALRGLAHGAAGLANIASDGPIADKPQRPDRPARFADLVALSLEVHDSEVKAALAAFREAFAPGPLALVEDEKTG